MTIVEISGYINTDTTITLKRNTENGYLSLKPFLPILSQLNNNNNNNTTTNNNELNEFIIDPLKLNDIVNDKEKDILLNTFGVLVDNDDNGEQWITSDKAIQILQQANLYDIFKDKLKDIINDNEEDKDDKQEVGITSSAVKRNESSLNNQIIDNQRTLGSPLKKMKLDNSNNKIDNLEDINIVSPTNDKLIDPSSTKQHAEQEQEVVVEGEEEEEEEEELHDPIPMFNHDLDYDILKLPLTIQKTRSSSSVMDNDQRLKLETFLQKLLFPTDENGEQTYTDIQSLLQELEINFPNVPLDLNIPVDEHGNTPLHWLTSIANINLVKDLVKIGSNRLLGDNNGESPLIKAVKSVNNYDSGTFEELLDYLYPCLILEDYMNRTILHHIVITSGMAGCSSAARYYLDILMGWIVKKDSRSVIDKDGIINNEPDSILKNLTLSWVLTNMLNVQDSNGDTCLNIAARLGNVGIVDALLEYGADPYIANNSGLRPADFGARTSTKDSNDLNNGNGSNDNNKSSNFNSQNNSHNDSDIILTQTDDDNNNTNTNNTNTNNTNNNNDDFKLEFMKEPDTMTLINDMKTLLANVTKDYEDELSEHKNKLAKLHEQLNSQRQQLTISRERLQDAKKLNDEHNLLKEQLNNLQKGIEEEETNFIQESQKLGISAEETSGIDWDSGEFDADEPFRVELIYDFLEKKLNNEYGGDIEKLLNEESVENVMKQIRSNHNDDDILNALPPSVLLKARINAYKKNDEHLQNMVSSIHEKQANLEGKFRRVLSLCLKVDESKVDGMLDGLLQAISSEDPQDMDTGEMQDFLNKHAIA